MENVTRFWPRSVQADDNAVIAILGLDGKPFIHWSGKQSSLDSPKEWSLPERWRAGVGANQCGVTFHTVRVRPVEAGTAPTVGSEVIQPKPSQDRIAS